MPLQDLSPPPPAPARSDPPEEFISKADAWLAWQETYAGEMTSLIAQLEVAAAMIATAGAYADPGLLALAGKTPAADRLPYYTGASTSALAVLTAAGRALLDDADAAAQRTTLGLGTAATQNTGAFEAAGAVSSGIAGHVAAADPHAQYLLETAVSAFMLTVLDDANAGAARATMGALGLTSVTFGSNTISLSITLSNGDTLLVQGGTGTLASRTTTTVTFPTSYATAPFAICAGKPSATGTEGSVGGSDATTTTGMQITNGSGSTSFYAWLAIGKA